MAATLRAEIIGFPEFESGVTRFCSMFTESALMTEVLLIAEAAGLVLKEEVLAQLVAAIYSQPAPEVLFSGSGLFDQGGNDTADRSGDLHDAHELVSDGLLQSVVVDMERPVSIDAHPSRETVGDYAIPVFEGYMQFIPTRYGESIDTGTFHPGRPWMETASLEGFDVLSNLVMKAFERLVTRAFSEAFA